MRLGVARFYYKVPEQGKWSKMPGSYTAGKHILPPKFTESQRQERIESLWREAKNEMWLVRNKRQNIQGTKI